MQTSRGWIHQQTPQARIHQRRHVVLCAHFVTVQRSPALGTPLELARPGPKNKLDPRLPQVIYFPPALAYFE